jgi:hydroxymethylbilane synthase
MKVVRVGTRRSLLARAQTAMVLENYKQVAPGYDFTEEVVLSSGDLKQGTEAASKGDKRDWIDKFEDRLSAGTLDLAVHCGKDVPCDIAEGLAVCSILERASAQDVFIGKLKADGSRILFNELMSGNQVGTASCRRKAQLLRIRPDLEVVEVRGNINTRLSILDDSDSALSGIILAEAGLNRLSLSLCYERLSTDLFLPAVNQGILAVEFLSTDQEVSALAARLTNTATELCFKAERAIIYQLKADCKSAVGVYAELLDSKILRVRAQVLASDGHKDLSVERSGSSNDWANLAASVADELITMGADKLLEQARKTI